MTLMPAKKPDREERELEADEAFERKMTFGEHLDELRFHLIRSAMVLVLLMILGWVFHERVERFVMGPYLKVQEQMAAQGKVLPKLTAVDMTEGFFFTLRVVFYGALVFGGPYFLFELWRFIAAGLYKHERRAVMSVLPVSIGLFVIGATFAYVVLIPISVEFMAKWPQDSLIKVDFRLDSYLSFFIILIMMLGVVFQLPLFQVILCRIGVLSAEKMAEYRKAFIMGAAVAAAVITPTGDPVTMSLVAVPMLILFEIGILLGRRVKPRTQNAGT